MSRDQYKEPTQTVGLAKERNQVDALQEKIAAMKAIIEEQKQELLDLYRRLYACDRPKRPY